MPLAQISLLEGSTDDQKRAVIQQVTDALVESTGVSKAAVRVLIIDLPSINWGVGGVPVKDLST